MDRTTRQKLAIKRWSQNNGCATLILPTGFGKTRIALTISQLLTQKNPNLKILVVVPTDNLKNQWLKQLVEWKLLKNVTVEIINTAIKKVQHFDLLICDEAHRYASDSFSKLFDVIYYKMILCLTGTLERLDGKEELIKTHAPICDAVTRDEAIENGWLADFKNYLVMIDVDLKEYKQWDQIFNQCFSVLNFDFNLGMRLMKDAVFRRKYAKQTKMDYNILTGVVMKWMKAMRKRKEFVLSHPKKIEITKKILNARKDKKSITFCNTIKDAESIKMGYVLHSKQKKKENEAILEKFAKDSCGVINSSKALNTGTDIPGLSVGIMLANTSSKITKQQSIGRCIRKEGDKIAEFFTLVIKGTQDVKWAINSSVTDYITISEEQLQDVLDGKEISTRKRNYNVDLENRF